MRTRCAETRFGWVSFVVNTSNNLMVNVYQSLSSGYMLERHFSAINNFAMFLDDEDVCQMLPIRKELFEAGVC